MWVWTVVDAIVVVINIEGVAVHVAIVVVRQRGCVVLVGEPVGLRAAAGVLQHVCPHVVVVVRVGIVASSVVVVVVLLRWVVWEDVLGVPVSVVDRAVPVNVVVEVAVAVAVHVESIADHVTIHVGWR